MAMDLFSINIANPIKIRKHTHGSLAWACVSEA